MKHYGPYDSLILHILFSPLEGGESYCIAASIILVYNAETKTNITPICNIYT